MPISTLELTTAVAVLAGAVVMAWSLAGMRGVLRLLGGGRQSRAWQLLFGLTVFFLLGYLATFALILAGQTSLLAVLAGVIFLFGALFVGLVVRVGQRTIADLLETTVSKQYVENILDGMADSLIAMNPDMTIRSVNRATASLLGRSERDLIGLPVSEILSPESSPSPDSPQETGSAEWTLVGRDGRRIPVTVTRSALFDARGEIETVVCVGHDVTDRVRAEEALRRGKEAAEAANRARGEFLANMSHEVRTPLNAIIGLTALALRQDLTPRLRDYLSKIRSSSESLLGIINDILDISRAEAGKIELESTPFDLRKILDRVAILAGDAAAGKGLEFLVSIEPRVPCCLVGDPLRLGQVLTNLANNAVKFTEQGQVVVRAEAVESSREQVLLRLSVQDSGVGIDPKILPDLFNPFTQADGSTTRRFGGSGLGLAICRHLVTLMGGKLDVDTSPGQGSTFSFVVPLKRQSGEEAAARLPPAAIQSMRVLVVDDNAMARQIMAEMLSSLSLRPTTAASGAEALKLLSVEIERDPYRLVLLDWKMPDMDGLETAQQIAERLGDRGPKIVLVTAYGVEGAPERADRAGLHGCLTKPISQSTLFDTILEVFGAPSETCRVCRAEAARDRALAELKGAKVLVVEDVPINREVLCETLRTAGIEVTVADHGRKAVEAVDAGTFDAVLMDVQMPEMDGYQATRAIRADPRFADLPIVAMTAHALLGDREKCLEAGMDDYLTKPIDVGQLATTLARWIRRSERNAEEPSVAEPTRAAARGSEVGRAPSRAEAVAGTARPGIDRDELLGRIGGNEDVLRSIVESFVESFAHTGDQIRSAWTNGDKDQAAKLIHSLKGVAGNVSARELHAEAVALEAAIKSGSDDQFRDRIERFEQCLAGVLGWCRAHLGGEEKR